PLAQGVAQFLGRKLAEATMAVELDLRESGTAFFRGNTAVLGLPPDSDGTWEVLSANPDLIEIRLGTSEKQLKGKAVIRDKDEFILKLEEAPQPPSAKQDEKADGQGDSAAAQKRPPASIVFKRQKD